MLLELIALWSHMKAHIFNKYSSSMFQLSEIVNSLSPQGHLPLGLALTSRSAAIANTLVQNGGANINSVNADVNILEIS